MNKITKKFFPEKTNTRNRTQYLLKVSLMLLFAFSGLKGWAQTTRTWSGATSGAWLTTTNWTGGVVAGSTTSSNNDIASFNNNTQVANGINMNTQGGNHYLGAVNWGTLATTARTINNSSTTAAGTLYLNGVTLNSISNTILWNESTVAHTIANGTGSGTMDFQPNNATNNVIQISGTGNISVSSLLKGSNPIQFISTNTGQLVLSSAVQNTYSGTITAQSSSTGRLTFNTITAYPNSTSFRANINTGASIFLNVTSPAGGTVYGASGQIITFNPNQTSVASLSSNHNNNVTVTLPSDIVLDANTRIDAPGATCFIALSGAISGSGGLIKGGNGTLTLSTANTYTGKTTINAGTISTTSINRFGTAPASFVADQITLDGGIMTFTGTSGATINSNSGITLGASGGTFNIASAANNVTLTTVTTGSGALTKSGGGTFIMTGAHTYTGLTTVSAGTLRLNRTGGTTIPLTNDVTVSGGTLQISTTQTLNNLTLASGATLSIDAGVTLTINGTFNHNGGTISLGAGSSIAYGSNGTLSYGGASQQTLNALEWPTSSGPVNIIINNAAGFRLNSSRTVSGNFTVTSGDVQNSSGTGVTLTLSGTSPTLSVAGSITGTNVGGGNDINLTYSNTTGTLIISGAGSLSRFLNVTVSNTGATIALSRTLETMFGTFTMNGTLQMNSGSAISSVTNAVAPTYGASSALIYNTSMSTGNEWTGGASTTVAAGLGIPANIQVLSGTVSLAGGRGVPGNVTITAGGLVLNVTSGDLYIGGNLTHNGAVWTNNNRAVVFVGTGTSTINTTANSGVQFFDYLLINKSDGSVQIGSSTNVTINSTSGSVLQFLNAGTLDLNGRTLTLNNSGGNILADGTSGGTSKSIISTTGAGTIAITNTKTASGAASGTLTTSSSVTWLLTGSMNFGSNITTINGTLQLNSGGSVATNPPTYGSSSTLIYNASTYGRFTEWSTTTGAGYPANVQIGNGLNTIFDVVNGTNTYKRASGNLTVNSGSTFSVPALTTGNGSGIGVEFLGNIINNGTITLSGGTDERLKGVTLTNGGTVNLSSTSGGDLELTGNYVDNAVFTANARAVFFTGTGVQTIGGIATAPFNIDYIVVTKASGSVQLLTSLLTGAPNGGNALTLTSSSDILELNGNTFTLGTNELASAVSGSGFIRGSSTSSLVLNGTGALGTLSFDQSIDGSTNALNNFTVNRTSGGAVTLGNTLKVNGATTGVFTITAGTVGLTGSGNTANILTLGILGTENTNWGSLSSSAARQNNTFFSGSGSVTVSNDTRTAATINTAPTASAINSGQALSASTLSGGTATPSGGSFAFTAPATIPSAGTADQSVTYTPADADQGNYTSATVNVSVTVNAATPTITGAATATAFTTTYGTASTAQTFSVGGTNLTANLVATAPTGFEVSSDDITYGSTATFTQSSGTATGSLIIRLSAAATVDGTYNGQNIVLSSNGATSVSIVTAGSGNVVSPATVTITPDAGQSKVFGATEPTFTYVASPSVAITGTLSRDAGENVGTYAYTVGNVSAGSNYTLSLGGNNTFAITPAAVTITPDAGQNKIFGAAEPTFTYVASPSVAITGALSRDAGENVGTYAYTLGNVSAGSNYTLSLGGSNTFAITPAAVTITPDAGQNKIFGAAEPTLTYVASPSVAITGGLSRDAGENVGTFNYTLGTLSAGSNYTLSLGGSNTFEITPAAVTATLANSPQTFTGSPIAAVINSNSGGTQSNIRYDGSPTVPTDAGTYAVLVDVAANGNYAAGTDLSAGDFVIIPIAPILSVTNTPQDFTGSPIAATVIGTGGGVVSNIKYAGSSTAPTSAGTYAITADIAESANYSAATDLVAGNFVISPIAPTLSVTNTPQEYTGSPIAATVIGTGGGIISNIKYAGSSTAPTNAGTYAITADIAASANYIAATDAVVGDFVISPIAPTLSITNTPQDYTGSPIAATIDGTGGGVVSNIKYDGSSTTPTNVGTYAITADIAASANYTPATDLAVGDFVISPISLTIIADNASKCFGDDVVLETSAFTSSGLISPETIESVTLTSSGADAGAAVNTYPIVPSTATGGTFLASNYTITYTNGTLTVNPTDTVEVASATPTLCVNTVLTEITHATTGATGIGTATNLPDGVTASFASNTITINGTPTVSGTFNYTIPLTGGCGNLNATGTIIVNDRPDNVFNIRTLDNVLCKYVGTATPVTFTAAAVSGAVSYIWTIPVGTGVTYISGQGTNNLVVHFQNAPAIGTNRMGNLGVKAVSSSGCESVEERLYPLVSYAPFYPGSATLTYNGVQKLRVGNFVGDATKTLVLTAGETTVNGAYSYRWDLPAGVNVEAGDPENDRVISINLGGVAAGNTNLVFAVSSRANCGYSPPRTLSLQRDLPLAPSALALTDAAISTSTRITRATAYIGTTTPLTLTATPVTTAGYESTSYKWVLPSGIAIVAASATLVSEDSGFKTYTSPSNVIRINLSGLSAVTSLLIQVYGVNGNGESLLSRDLTLTAAVPAAPAALRLTNDAAPSVAVTNVSTYIGTSTPLTLTATASVLATSYQWELPAGVNLLSGATTTSPGIASGISNVITVNFANVTAGTTNLYIGVKGVNAVGVSVTNNSSFVPFTSSTARLLRLSAALPAAAVVTGQIAGLCGGSYSYTITPSLLATSYLITAPIGSVVTSASNMSNNTNVLATSDLTFTVLYPIGFASTTAVGVKSIVIGSVNGVGSSLLNRTLSLSTLIPSIGTVTSTTAGATTFNQGLTAKVFTVPAVLGAIGYNWTVANGAVIVSGQGTNSITVDFSAVPTTTTRTIITVSATTPCGTSAVRTITLSFNSAATRLRQETVAVNATEVYPNPVSTNFNIDVTASKAGSVEISVYSLEGVLVVSPKSVQLEAGANTITENGSYLNSGIYILQLVNSSNNEIITKKLIKK